MKTTVRILSLLLCLFLIPVCTAFAEETAAEVPSDEKPVIKFRNLEWGSSPLDLLENEKDYSWNENVVYYSNEAEFNPKPDAEPIELKHVSNITLSYTCWDPIPVAGYTANETKLFYVRTAQNGYWSDETKDARLYKAYYKFTYEPRTDILPYAQELVDKLTRLYGEPTDVELETDGMAEKKSYWVWYGADNTVVRLSSFTNTSTNSEAYIYIRYGTLDGNQWLLETDDPTNTIDHDDLSGL